MTVATPPVFRVRLTAFSGPMDLLLHLVREREMDLSDIPVGQIAEDFLVHVRGMQAMDMEGASEFLLLAATLMEIKARMLLPPREGEESEEDPRWELVQKLLEYRRFKDAAAFLEGRGAHMALRFARPAEPVPEAEVEPEEPGSRNPWILFQSYSRLMAQLNPPRTATLTAIEVPLEQLRGEVLARCADGMPATLSWREIYAERRDRGRVVGLFLAVLELARMGLVSVRQEGLFGPVFCERRNP